MASFSTWEECRHRWVALPADMKGFSQGLSEAAAAASLDHDTTP
jgi:hypothetical protein